MCSLAESAIAYRAECALMGGGVVKAQRREKKEGSDRGRDGGREERREEGVGGFC